GPPYGTAESALKFAGRPGAEPIGIAGLAMSEPTVIGCAGYPVRRTVCDQRSAAPAGGDRGAAVGIRPVVDDIVFRLDVVEQSGGAFYVSCGSNEGGEASGELRAPVVDQLEGKLELLEQSVLFSGSRPVTRGSPGTLERPVREFGTTLFDAVLQGGVGVAFQRARGVANHSRRPLRVQLKVRSGRLAQLPWEFLFDPTEQDYL